MIKVLTGEKKLVKMKDVPFLKTLPRLEEFQMAKVWPKYEKDNSILKYLPDVEEVRMPSRAYFFQILSAVKPDDFNNLLNNTETVRIEKLNEKNQIVDIDNKLWQEIAETKYQKVFDTSQPSRRIAINKKQRKSDK